MWEPRVIYQQSYIYTTANIIRSREPSATKHFLKQFLFPQFLFIHNFSLQKLTALQKSSKQTHCKTEMASSDQWTEHPHFFLGNGETSRSAAVPERWARLCDNVPSQRDFALPETNWKDHLICVLKSHATLTNSPRPFVSALERWGTQKRHVRTIGIGRYEKRISAKALSRKCGLCQNRMGVDRPVKYPEHACHNQQHHQVEIQSFQSSKLTWNCIGRWVGKWKPMLIWDKTSRKTNWHVPHLPQDSHVLFSFPCCFSVSVWEKREETKIRENQEEMYCHSTVFEIWFTTYSP